MKFFIDTANIEDIKKAHRMGILSGVTTNPSLVVKEGVKFEERILEICRTVTDVESVSAEVSPDVETAEEMISQGLELASIDPKVTIKLPMTTEGLVACKALSSKGITTNVTLIFTVNQALLAARAGATYVSPFLGRLDDISQDGVELVAKIAEVIRLHKLPTQIIAASVRHPDHVTRAALAGAHIATIPFNVIEELTKHPLTNKGIAGFVTDWQKAKK